MLDTRGKIAITRNNRTAGSAIMNPKVRSFAPSVERRPERGSTCSRIAGRSRVACGIAFTFRIGKTPRGALHVVVAVVGGDVRLVNHNADAKSTKCIRH